MPLAVEDKADCRWQQSSRFAQLPVNSIDVAGAPALEIACAQHAEYLGSSQRPLRDFRQYEREALLFSEALYPKDIVRAEYVGEACPDLPKEACLILSLGYV